MISFAFCESVVCFVSHIYIMLEFIVLVCCWLYFCTKYFILFSCYFVSTLGFARLNSKAHRTESINISCVNIIALLLNLSSRPLVLEDPSLSYRAKLSYLALKVFLSL